MNEKPIVRRVKILFLEDVEEDFQQTLRELNRGGFEVNATRVYTEPAFRTALAQGGFDLILADFLLPSFNAQSALQVYKENGSIVPFIIVSGVIGEETAVQMMEAGARDFLPKENLIRLNAVVLRELRDSELRRGQRSDPGKEASAENITGHLQALERALSKSTPVADQVRFDQALEQVRQGAAEALHLLEKGKSNKAHL